jgi:hypothetical protein
MIPVSNKTRSITRVRYMQASCYQQENIITILAAIALQPHGVSIRRRRQNEIDCRIISPGED